MHVMCPSGNTRRGRPHRSMLVMAAIVLGFAAGCSLEYGDARIAEAVPDALPNARIDDFVHTVVRRGRKQFIVRAETALRYDDAGEQQLYDVSFEEYGADGEVVAYGRAAFARYFDDSEDVELYGEIEFTSVVEEAIITAGYLYWDREERLLFGAEDQAVHVRQEDGTELSGYGFLADMKLRNLTFEREIRGRYVE